MRTSAPCQTRTPGCRAASRSSLQRGTALALLLVAGCGLPCQPQAQLPMPERIVRSSADRNALESTYTQLFSTVRLDRLERFDRDELQTLKDIRFEKLSRTDQLDYLLLENLLHADQRELALRRAQRKAMEPVLPFVPALEAVLDAGRRMETPPAEATARTLTEAADTLDRATRDLHRAAAEHRTLVTPSTANRAVGEVVQLRNALKLWFEQWNAYDPQFTWWVPMPYHRLEKALEDYVAALRKDAVGIAPEDKTAIVGDPVGRDVLLDELAAESIPYTPEEMIAIAQTEYDWCLREMLKASRDLGFGDDWHAAVEKVKTMHVPPGEQPALIRDLVREGIAFVKANDLVTVPPLAEETWHMVMMTPERQLVNPFFTGGDEISVSYPTDTMTFGQREMSMRGNNIPFAHATVFHEMIPGHFLQGYMSRRHHAYREPFATPFWIEGNALWWEMLLWDKGFERTPEERVGALVWRMHRSARVIFTMNFHLGQWTPAQCVQFLVEHVGFEQDNAVAEVRRSFDGSVGPLYQSAYLMGALQFRALHHELVDSHRMSERAFADTVLEQNAMPLSLLRALLEDRPWAPGYKAAWTFYGEHPAHAPKPAPHAEPSAAVEEPSATAKAPSAAKEPTR